MNEMTKKLKGYVDGLDHPHWSKTIGQIDETIINDEVERLVAKSEKMEAKRAVILLDK